MKMNKKTKNKKWKVKFHPKFWESADRLFSNNLRYLIPRAISNWKYEIKWAWQRVFQGYDDRITWGLDWWLSENIPKILRKMKSFVHGHPAPMTEDKKKWKIKTLKDWKDILEKIARGFEVAREIQENKYMKQIKLKKSRKDIFGQDSHIDYVFDKKHYNKLYKEFEEGIDLFKKHYFSLWD